MKKIITTIIGSINTLYIIFFSKQVFLKDSFLYFVKTNVQPKNEATFKHCKISSTIINVLGNSNKIHTNNCLLEDCKINISGSGNQFFLEKGVKLRNATIHIRGKNCLVKIGTNTTTGGIRIVNVGTNNNIEIGSDCLFADNIEIWASDTHSIYNENKEKINHEKPIIIGNHVWVGSHVMVLKGVTIKKNSIVGMGSIITKDIPEGVISVGSPNRNIKENVTWDAKY